jgi:hypothetical protein
MTWTMANIGDHLPAEVWESFINHHTAAGVLLGTLFLALGYPLIDNILLSKPQVYHENLDLGHQVVVLQHSIEAVYLSLIFIPYTYVTLSVNFEEQQYDSFKNKIAVILPLCQSLLSCTSWRLPLALPIHDPSWLPIIFVPT